MRTTLTLDPDNAVRLERLQKERGAAFKDVVNEVIRRGLDDLEKAKPSERFRTPVLSGTPVFRTPDELRAIAGEIQDGDGRRKLGLL